jgi:hypothetical protein
MDIKQRTPPPGENQGSNLEQSHLEKPAGLQFLTFTHVDQIKDPKIQRRVRSHVMQGVKQRKGKKGDWKKNPFGYYTTCGVNTQVPKLLSGSHPFAQPVRLGSG